jgi:hypothetical protein
VKKNLKLLDLGKTVDQSLIADVTPELVAEIFAEMDAEEQARFFNHISEVASKWGASGYLEMQLQAITDDCGLTLAGRRVMQEIGEYSHWGLVPKAKE